MKLEKAIIEKFYTNFNQQNVILKTRKKDYILKAFMSNKMNVPYDISINIGNRILTIIEFKHSSLLELYNYSKIEKYSSENRIRLFAISDGDKFIVTNRRNPNQKEIVSFDEFINIIVQQDKINVEELKTNATQIIKELILSTDFRFLKEQFGSFIDQLAMGLEYDEIDRLFYFKNPTDIENVENKIFRLLLKDDKPLNRIYRYTTVNSVFLMLNNNSFRMNCLVGMNDTTEVNYVENYITGTNRNYTQAPWQTIDSFNKRFISSCSLKEDDLTQWRLYAEDSKGVCLVLKVDEALLNSKFILKRISYGKPDGTHPELDLIKNIIAALKSQLNIDMEFRTLKTWKHFFKPSDYSVEEEVRLLYIFKEEDGKKGWILTNSHGILNPYIEFKLNGDELPIELTEIVLGPKSPEKEINQRQFEQFIRELRRKMKTISENGVERQIEEYNLSNLNVSISKIKNYR